MKFLLDTDTCIYAMKGVPSVLEHLLAQPRSDIALSVVTEAELRCGAAKSASPKSTAKRLDHFLAPLTLLDFTSTDAAFYADVSAQLEKAGTPIGPLHTFIAAHALARGLILVTNNQREFCRIEGLNLQNWRD